MSATGAAAAASVRYGEVVAIIAAFNEADIIECSLTKLVEQGIGVYLIDNWSTDATMAQAEQFTGQGLLGFERFPPDGPTPFFALRTLLRRVEELHRDLGAHWTIHQDVDEIRASPWPGVTYRQGLERVEREGYNCVNHVVVDFRPTADDFQPGEDFEKHFRYFERPDRPGHLLQMRTWRTVEEVDLQPLGGHCVQFSGKRVYPRPFVIKHYPIRGQAHGERKVLRERVARFDPEERASGMHVHYDGFGPGSTFTWDRNQLVEWNDATRQQLVEESALAMSRRPKEFPG